MTQIFYLRKSASSPEGASGLCVEKMYEERSSELMSELHRENILTQPEPGGIVAFNMKKQLLDLGLGTMTMSTTPRISRGALVVGQG